MTPESVYLAQLIPVVGQHGIFGRDKVTVLKSQLLNGDNIFTNGGPRVLASLLPKSIHDCHLRAPERPQLFIVFRRDLHEHRVFARRLTPQIQHTGGCHGLDICHNILAT